MKTLEVNQTTITQSDIEWLDETIERYTTNYDAVVDVSELDGLITAVVVAPKVVHPKVWQPAIWQPGERPRWQNKSDRERFYALLASMQQQVAFEIGHEPESYQPIFSYNTVDGKRYRVVDSWCRGFLKGVQLCKLDWYAAVPQFDEYLSPIMRFGDRTERPALRKRPYHQIETYQDLIIPAVISLCECLQNNHDAQITQTSPCPCGSGKLLKDCCLH